MTPDRISAEVSVAVAAVKARIATESTVYAVPRAWTKCRWCRKALVASATMPWYVRVGFCSHACVADRYEAEG